ncbi:MAG: sodium:proton antiporter [Friedmanniella sp.]|jgi:hypothetical protein|nr:sodium:proton antiporter [Friedmanniella sp.]
MTEVDPKQDDDDPADGRDETRDERMDRNWAELLQELRVTQTGTQVLTGFLLGVAFQPTFAHLSPFQRHVYLAVVATAVLTTALGLAPVNLHRAVFRQHAKQTVVQVGHVIVRAVLAGVGLVLVGVVLLVFDLALDRSAAYLAAGLTLLGVLGLALIPRLVGRS